MEINKLVRPNIRKLVPYSSARDEFKGSDAIFLDANENPFGELNRYPDPYQKKLKTAVAEIKNVATNNIFIGNGSDEVIDLIFRIFCEPGKDKALTFTPTYGMYDVSAAINDVALIKQPLNEQFQIDTTLLMPLFKDKNLKLILICTPNNPTANVIDNEAIEFILHHFKGIVVIDEAYADFSENASWNQRIAEFANLIVSQTFSKAWGLAAARVGMAFASDGIIGYFNKVKPPYNVSTLNQKAALQAIENKQQFIDNLHTILNQKQILNEQLLRFSMVKKIYPSDANFLLVEFDNANAVYEKLSDVKIVVRNRSNQVFNALRITIGTPDENAELISKLKEL